MRRAACVWGRGELDKEDGRKGGKEGGKEGGREGEREATRTFGAPSTSSLASLRPKPLMVRTLRGKVRKGGGEGGREGGKGRYEGGGRASRRQKDEGRGVVRKRHP
jgi:hypothetical protein